MLRISGYFFDASNPGGFCTHAWIFFRYLDWFPTVDGKTHQIRSPRDGYHVDDTRSIARPYRRGSTRRPRRRVITTDACADVIVEVGGEIPGLRAGRQVEHEEIRL